MHSDRAEPGVVVCGSGAAADLCYGLAVAIPDGQRIRHGSPVWAYGSHQGDWEALGVDALWHANLQQPCGRRRRCDRHRVRLAGTATKALLKDPMIAEQAAIAASWAVAVVVVCSAIFAAFKDEFLGHEDPHWHKSNAVSVEVMSE